jgi:predicted ATP-dependent endonuclease of OLD family
LLLEEPELSLHEEIVAQLPSIFSHMDKTKKKGIRQIFVTTHSNAMLRVPGIGANEVIRFEPDREGTKVLPPEPHEIAVIQRGELNVADLLLPKTRPANVERLRLF